MKQSARLALFVVAVLFAAVEMRAQDSNAVRPRVVATAHQEPKAPPPITAPQAAKPAETGTLPVINVNEEKKVTAPTPISLTPSVIQGRISEAQRMFKTKPKPTALP